MFRTPSARGFSLIELMVAVVVSSIVVLGIFAFASIQRATVTIHERNIRVQQALEGAMWSVAQDVQLAGMGYARLCSELRVWDAETDRLINPGGVANPTVGTVVTDQDTGEPYWVLRDGLQAHWQSVDGTMTGLTSALLAHPSDSFDVIVADATYTEAAGVFRLDQTLANGAPDLVLQTGTLLNNGTDLAEVQQMFPPGSFVIVTRSPSFISVRPEAQGQCLLLQVTGSVAADPDNTNLWRIPIGVTSGFNENIGGLLDDPGGAVVCDGCVDDWEPAADNFAGAAGSVVVPLGRLRWSRYEIDYTVPEVPYLVRSDIIGYQVGVDPAGLGDGVQYPGCEVGGCTAAQLHLPGSAAPPIAIAIGPMIEDMQVAVGCDGYTVGATGNQRPVSPLAPPEVGFAEVDSPANPGIADRRITEVVAARGSDEWLGNGLNEVWAPDCVYHGTAEYNAAAWLTVEGANPPPSYRMSPQTIRITLVASSEFVEEAGGLGTDQLPAVEDRPALTSPVGIRQRFSLTERFSPKNLRWRDPAVL